MFLMQVLSLMPRKVGAALASVAVIVSFSGLDVVGTCCVCRVRSSIGISRGTWNGGRPAINIHP